MACFDLRDVELAIIELLLPNVRRGVARIDDHEVLKAFLVGALARLARALWSLHNGV